MKPHVAIRRRAASRVARWTAEAIRAESSTKKNAEVVADCERILQRWPSHKKITKKGPQPSKSGRDIWQPWPPTFTSDKKNRTASGTNSDAPCALQSSRVTHCPVRHDDSHSFDDLDQISPVQRTSREWERQPPRRRQLVQKKLHTSHIRNAEAHVCSIHVM